jgi:hypothetical protein
MNTKELLKLHDDTCKSCRDIMLKKNNDYTGGKKATDIFANFNSSKILDIHPVQGLLLRVIDKVQRIRSFTNDKELSVPNETVEDACDDIVNYAILAKAMLLNERAKKLPTGEEEARAEKRMDIIGQNGNEGLHYSQIEQENAK